MKFKDMSKLSRTCLLISLSLQKWHKDGKYISGTGVIRVLVTEDDSNNTVWRSFSTREELDNYIALRKINKSSSIH